ncbi:MAG: hypothetical protein ACJA06_001084 [Halocynthiibacter sp.]|jgi:hypothetical protein
MIDQTPVFVCLKWGEGYPTLYTNTLFRALSALMDRPFRLACITDEPDGLLAGIEIIPSPKFTLPKKHWVPGMWPKLAAFQPGLFEDGTPIIMIDVDVVIIQDLGPLVDHILAEPGLHIIHDWHDSLERWFPKIWNNERLSNSSVVGFRAGEQGQIWRAFEGSDWAALKPYINDQAFIHHYAENRKFWPQPWVLSFKKSLCWHVPVNLFRPVPHPKEAYIVAFHGVPDPEDVSGKPFQRWGSPEKFGFFPVKWVKDYWDRFSR